jgi:transposase
MIGGFGGSFGDLDERRHPDVNNVSNRRRALFRSVTEYDRPNCVSDGADRPKDYPETALLQQVGGVGPLIALTFILTVEDKDRFQKSRDIGCYVGLRPRRSDSGQSQPQLRITKEGDPYLRTLLVQGAHYIISRRGPDTDLKRWGLHLAKRGGKRGKKRAVVAVARKLGILLHRLLVTGEVYEPLRNHNLRQEKKKVAA